MNEVEALTAIDAGGTVVDLFGMLLESHPVLAAIVLGSSISIIGIFIVSLVAWRLMSKGNTSLEQLVESNMQLREELTQLVANVEARFMFIDSKTVETNEKINVCSEKIIVMSERVKKVESDLQRAMQ